MTNSKNHISVMPKEALAELKVESGAWFVDATFGSGGHTQLILDQGGKVVAFDFDDQAITRGNKNFAKQIKSGQLILVRENFAQIEKTIKDLQQENKIGPIKGILFDMGTSTEQLMDSDRGFSFEGQGPLDMRLDDRLGVTATDLLTILSQKDLKYMFQEFGGEHEANAIAKAIVEERKESPINTTEQLANLIKKVKKEKTSLHPATKVFQALRIVVNDEISNIEVALPQAIRVADHGARIITIAFHQGEDKVAKNLFKNYQDQGVGEVVYKKPLQPTELEIKSNPRSRSAKLRVFIKL